MKQYTFIDYATQGYILIVGLLILLFHNATVPEWPWLLLAHAGALVGVHALVTANARWPGRPLLEFLRSFYPVLLYTGFYRETGALNRMLVPDYLDAWFILAEQRIFGFQPCIAFMEALPVLAVSEVLYACYFSYYIMISGIGIALFLRDRRQFFHYVAVVSFVFYLCYLTYICLPVMGPRAFYREIDGFHLPEEVQALAGNPTYPSAVQIGPFFNLMAWIYRHFEGPGAAFPSSHVAIALCTAWFSWRYLPRIRWFHSAVVFLLCLATVYCRYHYAIDVLAGALTAAILVPLGNRLYHRFSAPRPHSAGLIQ
ncbi:MAG TPA: phosphatase PAP2 family protein [Verrucomicrobiota bacterium]|nr:phosphatase PAP2 family protein [Verrucomicrobiota bacterium]HNU49583.1 phosphatase PAP2 family protein [Verrucomicrobiota bacterium]